MFKKRKWKIFDYLHAVQGFDLFKYDKNTYHCKNENEK